jgi:DNA-binding transcriptional ArsR family regulator
MPRPRKRDQISAGAGADLVCDDRIVHMDAVRAARTRVPAGDRLGRLGELFSTLGDITRLRIVAALLDAELCVCDLAATVGASESAVSHHLRSMREQGLVRARRDGRLVYYSLDDAHVSELYRQGIEHVAHGPEGDAS